MKNNKFFYVQTAKVINSKKILAVKEFTVRNFHPIFQILFL